MAWAPQRSKDTYSPLRSIAYARTHGGDIDTPDPAGSIMYLVCNRRRQIWALKPNLSGSGPAFQVLASRGPLWPDTPTLKSDMGDIGGDSTGAWYRETPAVGQANGPSRVSYTGTDGITRTVQPIIHRLDSDLNIVASYFLGWTPGSFIGSVGTWANSTGMGGSGGTIITASQSVDIVSSNGDSIFIPGGLVSGSIATMQSDATAVFTTGLSRLLVKSGSNPTANWAGTSTVASGGLPITNYDQVLSPANPQVTSSDGDSGNAYACKTGGLDYMARWSGGQLVAVKTPNDATQQDQFRAQCIGGGPGICYTTENNNEIVLRDGGLNLTARFRRADIEQFLGATNPANGISNFVFTGIGGS